jgi:phosphoribosylformylglycinamidine (FGAM) synthase-like enzyme
LGGSEYLVVLHDQTAGEAPHLDLAEEKAVQDAMLSLIRAGFVQHAHDVSDGGLAACLAESVIGAPNLGADIALNTTEDIRLDALLFGEAQSRICFSIKPEEADAVQSLLQMHPGVQGQQIGTVNTDSLRIKVNGTERINLTPAALTKPFEEALPNLMGVL